MKRKIERTLEKYLKSADKKALVVKGTRQVGKTYSILSFLSSHYRKERIVTINFMEQGEAKRLFLTDRGENSLHPESVLFRLGLMDQYRHLDLTLRKGDKIALFFDEIQESPEAVTSLKFFAMQREYFDVYASGSYLGFLETVHAPLPTGYVHYIDMFGLDFEEFLWAMGYKEKETSDLKTFFGRGSSLDGATHEKLCYLFRLFIVLGRLPEPIQKYLDCKDLDQCAEIQEDLFAGFIGEVNKHFTLDGTKENAYIKNEKLKNISLFQSIPLQLSQLNRKFTYRRVSSGGRERMYQDNIAWLSKAMLISRVNNVKRLSSPLFDSKDEDSFKLFYFDTGILLTQFPPSLRQRILTGNDEVSPALELSLGGVYENEVSALLCKKYGNNDAFYHRDGVYEIDFVVERDGRVYGIEVKSGNNLKSNSLRYFLSKDYPNLSFVRLSNKQINEPYDRVIDLPFYAFGLLAAS